MTVFFYCCGTFPSRRIRVINNVGERETNGYAVHLYINRHAGTYTKTETKTHEKPGYHTVTLYWVWNRIRACFVPLPFSVFWRVRRTLFPSGWCFFYLVTTGRIFDIKIWENSVYIYIAYYVKLAPNRVIGEMVLDGGGHFTPASIFGLHTLSLLLSPQAAHDRDTEVTHQYKRHTH